MLQVIWDFVCYPVNIFTGKNAQYLVDKKWHETIRGILLFAAVGVPASFVNSGLKYETSILSLRFRKRLTEKINQDYIKGMNFYKASHLAQLDTVYDILVPFFPRNNCVYTPFCNANVNAVGSLFNTHFLRISFPIFLIISRDQRITADIQKFGDQLSDLYTMMFKPILDIILVTHKLSGYMGIVGPLYLFLHYILVAIIKKYSMPAFGKVNNKRTRKQSLKNTNKCINMPS